MFICYFVVLYHQLKGNRLQQKQIPTEWEFPTNNEPIRGIIMTNKVSILNFINNLNSLLDEEFDLHKVSLSEISFSSKKSNLFIKIERFSQGDESFKYIVGLYEMFYLDGELEFLNLTKGFEKLKPVSVEDIVYLIKHKE